ncbi:MAG: DNA-protecting protein DprA [Clostridia bacterium]|nr:DNA-protecting protein DprA [Clostridia bacterium]
MKTYSKEELCLIWLDSFIGLEYKHKIKLYQTIRSSSSIKNLLEENKDFLISSIGEGKYANLLSSANGEYLKFITDNLNKKEITCVTLYSSEYPERLKELSYPPLVIYAKGDLSLMNSDDLFAIVGSRRSLPLSLKLAKSYTEELSDVGFIPVTGIADGVDAEVLKTAVLNKTRAISVIAGGFDNVYPKVNVTLLEDVIKCGGLAISEYPPQTVSMPFHFPVRNRIIAALSKGVLVVSGGLKSGTSYTAEYATELSKEVFAIPYSVGVQSGAGCNELIKKGGILTDSPQDIIAFYGKEKKKITVELTDEEREIVKALSDGELHVEKLASVLNKEVFLLTPTLSILEIKGMIVRSGNVFGLARNDLEV